MRCSGLWDSNSRCRSSAALEGLRPIDILILCMPGWTSVRVRNHTIYGCMTGKDRALMLENTPRIVCLPEAGSIWTPSHVIQARREGFDCTPGGWVGVRERQNYFAPTERGPSGCRVGACADLVGEVATSSDPTWEERRLAGSGKTILRGCGL